MLGLDSVTDTIYCPSQKPGVKTSLDNLKLTHARVVELSARFKKPDRQVLEHIVASNNVAPERTLLVGNSIIGDGISTIGTGVKFVLADWGQNKESEERTIDYLTGAEIEGKRTKEREFGHLVPLVRIEAILVHTLGDLHSRFDFAAALKGSSGDNDG